ncbi:FHA domain-containing protein [Comamonas sp. Y33R10-2]|uniref:FHA domain-containing protein n=1 Tax=Comamonas sp. Y33R10-2 TaxID=2853257 RepID=UPI001C5C9F31|nr:FHA domain-containing protein [Comamonas sp. Y33R10-2]QXZ08645.1 FHA domain-containing protein [Comamonas sp. Y33R10-2]
MPTLVISIDGAVIKEAKLTKERTTLGRRPYNDIVIENLAVSGEHAVIVLSGGKVSIEDLRSTNGTYVNGRAIQKQQLLNGDLLDIGRYKIRFLDSTAEGADTPAVAAINKVLAHISEEADSDYAKLATPSGFGEISSFASTIQGSLSALPERHAVIRMLSGSLQGKEVPLFKVVTTLGKPGVAIASITQKPHGFVLTQLEGASEDLKLNGQVVGPLSVPLLNGDTVDLAGSSMRFVVE